MSTSAVEVQGWIPEADSFGARLALVRQRMGWGNVAEAALACGLPVSSLRNWERDGRIPRDYIHVCTLIAERTGVDLGWLVGMPNSGNGITTTGTSGSYGAAEALNSRCFQEATDRLMSLTA
jgi:hypothetical protein